MTTQSGQHGPRDGARDNVDDHEVARFAALASKWWDPEGEFRPLHQIGPVRLEFIVSEICSHHRRERRDASPLAGLRVLDIGCGGGLISEPLARLGAEVTGIDPAEASIEAARIHAARSGLDIDYRCTTAEDLLEDGEQFDAVLCLEVVEHVPDVGALVATCAGLSADDGLLVFSTINRTMKAFALAIVGAEYVLRWLPRGTHSWEKFVTPDELRTHLVRAGAEPREVRGMVYRPLFDKWALSADTDVNYLLSATAPRPGRAPAETPR